MRKPSRASSSDSDTVYLTNASEVALSLLEIEQAEDYLKRAAQYVNPDSVADPGSTPCISPLIRDGLKKRTALSNVC